MTITYNLLLTYLRRGLRNGNWRRLEKLERAFYRASLMYAKIRNKIVNPNIIAILKNIIEKLKETPGLRILKAGLERARHMLTLYRKSGVFKWCPQIKGWLQDPAYILWLGLTEGIYRLTPLPP